MYDTHTLIANRSEAFTPSELSWPGATSAQLEFMRKVYKARVTRSSRRGTFVNDVTNADLELIEGNRKMRKEAAPMARQLLSDARRAIATAAVNVNIGVASAYRSASQQFRLWQRYFPDYYRRTQEHRRTLSGGEHGIEALRYMTRFVGVRIGTPGYSNHNNGLAIDLRNMENNVLLRNRTNRVATAAWRRSWLWRWLSNHAPNYNLYQNTRIDEPWHWEYRAPQTGSPDRFWNQETFENEYVFESQEIFTDEFDDQNYFSEYASETVRNLAQAVRANRRYGISLGWNVHHVRINDLLLPFSGQQNVSLREDAFAHALSSWQSSKGLSSDESDGILGPNTWRLMQTALGISSPQRPQAPSSPVASSSATPQAEWNNSPNIQARYPNLQAYLTKRTEVSDWGVPNPGQYIESAISEWNGSSNVHHYFGSFDGNPRRSYLNLKRLYNSKGIQNPAQYISSNIRRLTFFGKSSPGHVILKQKLGIAEQRLKTAGHNFTFQNAWSFVPRTFNNNINKLSNHALGKAIDIDHQSNPHITNGNEMKIIEAVCNTILVNGFLRERNPDVFRRASNHFKATFNSQWISRQTDPNILSILRSRSRMRKLEKYARLGFCTLPGNLVRALQNAGLTWGGTWSSAKDFMHFETV